MSQVPSVHVRRLTSRVERTTARIVDHATRLGLSVADLPGLRLPWYEIRNQNSDGTGVAGDDEAEVLTYEEIGGSLGITADQFARDLQAITAPVIRVRINSPGGAVFDAIAIHSALLHHPAKVRTYVDGYAASAASVIAMAADPYDEQRDTGGIIMMPGSQMMIHDASMMEDGNPADHEAAATFLHRQSDNIADMYRRRAGGEAAEWREMMRAETWMFADEAVELGLADRVEQRPIPADVQERMGKRHDLRQHRYAGREAAPVPAPLRHRQQVRRSVSAHPRAENAQTFAVELREAGARRAAAAGGRQALTGPPGGQARTVSTEWMRRSGRLLTPTGPAVLPPRLTATRTEKDGKQFVVVEGYYTVYERGYEMWDEYGPYVEIVSSGAGEKTTAANPDVIFLVNHRGLAMARTTAGTLELWSDDTGGGDRAWLNPQRRDVMDLVLGIEDGTITEQSFAFMIEAGRWNADFTQYRIDAYDIDRGDTSAVNYGANPQTSIAARAREILDELDHLPAGAARAALDRLTHRADLDMARSAPPVAAHPVIDTGPAPDEGASSGMTTTTVEAWLVTIAAKE